MVTHDPGVARGLAGALTETHPGLSPSFLGPGEARELEPALAMDVSACRLAIGYPVAPAAATRAYAAWATRLGVDIRVGAAARPWLGAGRVAGRRAGRWASAGGRARGRRRGAVDARTSSIRAERGGRSGRRGASSSTSRWSGRRCTSSRRPRSRSNPSTNRTSRAAPRANPSAWSPPMPRAPSDRRSSTWNRIRLPSCPRSWPVAPGIVPEIASATVGPHRVCARPQSVDGRPLVGRVPGLDGSVGRGRPRPVGHLDRPRERASACRSAGWPGVRAAARTRPREVPAPATRLRELWVRRSAPAFGVEEVERRLGPRLAKGRPALGHEREQRTADEVDRLRLSVGLARSAIPPGGRTRVRRGAA